MNAARPDPDSFLELIAACRTDARADKIDLLVGVYRDELGITPVMASIKAAERILTSIQESKSYLPVAGRESFTSVLMELVLGHGFGDRACGIQTIGGAGALRLLLELARCLEPRVTVWVAEPAYPGHSAIAAGAGLPIRRFPYDHSRAGKLDEDQMLQALSAAKAGDVVILDASCHNPSGVDLSESGWAEAGRLCQRNGLIPLVDVAYQGLGKSIAADRTGIPVLSRFVEVVFAAASCSKIFGIYRERAGVAMIVGATRERLNEGLRRLTALAFAMYGVPPDHGAAIVEIVLSDLGLRQSWQTELTAMRERIRSIREQLWKSLAELLDERSIAHIGSGSGLFTQLPLTERQMCVLHEVHGIYGLSNGRINLACLPAAQIPRLRDSIVHVLNA